MMAVNGACSSTRPKSGNGRMTSSSSFPERLLRRQTNQEALLSIILNSSHNASITTGSLYSDTLFTIQVGTVPQYGHRMC